MSLVSETDVWFCLSDSGVGAGIDSYYEYLLKAYILLGDDMFLQRFNIVSNLISPCLHNSIYYISTLTQCFSLYLLESVYLKQKLRKSPQKCFYKAFTRMQDQYGLRLEVCMFCLALRLHYEVH